MKKTREFLFRCRGGRKGTTDARIAQKKNQQIEKEVILKDGEEEDK